MTTRLQTGDQAPDFALESTDGSTVRLSALRGQKVVLFVYPAASTPGCTKQACDLRDNHRMFLDAGYRRYLERKFRERFGYHGTPIRVAVRIRERRQKPR